MSLTRRALIATSAGLAGLSSLPGSADSPDSPSSPEQTGVDRGRKRDAGYDPWLEVDASALAHNVRQLARLSGDRPILGVVKNNAYGLGVRTVGPMLDALDPIAGLAVVKAGQALALRDAGVRKPILLMGLFDEADAPDLVARGIQLAPFTDDDPRRLERIARRLDQQIPVHLYLDTGMSRLGMPYRRAVNWIEELAASKAVRIEGAFTTFVEEDDYDPVQLGRLLDVARQCRQRGIGLGRLHAASSHGIFFRPKARLDMVRPGLALYGAYPDGAPGPDSPVLKPAIRLMAPVVRVERLEVGDTVSYGRRYVAEKPTWVATLPIGHAEGYPRSAVKGCEVLIGGRLYPVIGAVSASHCIVEVGEHKTVGIGDEATLIGPDHPAIHPNAVAQRADISVYDVLMHLSAGLPKRVGQAS